jgi:hypothetical protein
MRMRGLVRVRACVASARDQQSTNQTTAVTQPIYLCYQWVDSRTTTTSTTKFNNNNNTTTTKNNI